VGYASIPPSSWAPGLPLWRIDLETGEAGAFTTPDASLMPLLNNNPGAPLFSGGDIPALPDGRVGVLLYDGLGVGLYLAEPGAPWRPVGRRVRGVSWIGWTPGPALAIAAETNCHCYGPLMLKWPEPPAGASPELLSATSLQFVAPDGTDVLPPTQGEHLVSFADRTTSSCALTSTDAHEWFVTDTQARTRRALGKLDALSWATEPP
jgi:hypothetical protein